MMACTRFVDMLFQHRLDDPKALAAAGARTTSTHDIGDAAATLGNRLFDVALGDGFA